MGKISSITVVQNNKNKGKPKANPLFNKNDKNDNKGTEEQSMMNPLEQFDISNNVLDQIILLIVIMLLLIIIILL